MGKVLNDHLRQLLYVGVLYLISSAACCKPATDEKDCRGEWDSTAGKEVLTFTEEMPQFGKGTEDLQRFIAHNYKIPDQGEFQASFNLRFIVDTDGKAKYFEVKARSNEEGWISDESRWTIAEKVMIEAFRKMPAWKPGKCNGKEVAVRMVLPIRF